MFALDKKEDLIVPGIKLPAFITITGSTPEKIKRQFVKQIVSRLSVGKNRCHDFPLKRIDEHIVSHPIFTCYFSEEDSKTLMKNFHYIATNFVKTKNKKEINDFFINKINIFGKDTIDNKPFFTEDGLLNKKGKKLNEWLFLNAEKKFIHTKSFPLSNKPGIIVIDMTQTETVFKNKDSELKAYSILKEWQNRFNLSIIVIQDKEKNDIISKLNDATIKIENKNNLNKNFYDFLIIEKEIKENIAYQQTIEWIDEKHVKDLSGKNRLKLVK